MHKFRLRDCDTLIRFNVAAALACNDLEQIYVALSEDQLQIIGELGVTLHDAAVYGNDRQVGGRMKSSFAFSDFEAKNRAPILRHYRNVLSAMDVLAVDSPAFCCAVNVLRSIDRDPNLKTVKVGQNTELWYNQEALVTSTSKDLQRY